jgi:hypothetical protein
MGRQKTLDQMVLGIPQVQSAIKFFMNAVSIC